MTTKFAEALAAAPTARVCPDCHEAKPASELFFFPCAYEPGGLNRIADLLRQRMENLLEARRLGRET
jgi:hypothetical protein